MCWDKRSNSSLKMLEALGRKWKIEMTRDSRHRTVILFCCADWTVHPKQLLPLQGFEITRDFVQKKINT